MSSNANPTCKTRWSIGSTHLPFIQQPLQGPNGPAIACENQGCAFVEDSVGFGVESLHSIGFDDRDNRCAGHSPHLQIADRFSDTCCAWHDREPLEQKIIDDDLGRWQGFRYVG